MNDLVEALKIVGPIAAGVLIAGAKPIAAYAEVIRARGAGRKSDPPSGQAPREPRAPAPVQTLIGIGPVTRVEYEAMAHRVAHLEDELRRAVTANERLDARLDEEIRARNLAQQEVLRETGLTNTRLAEMVGRMDGHLDNLDGSRSRRGR